MKYAFRKKRLTLLASAVDAAGRLLSVSKRTKPFPAAPKKVLLVRLDHLGDILPATALPQLVKENFGGARVHFLTTPSGEALLKHNPYVDKTWTFDPGWYARDGKPAASGMKYGDLVRALRAERIDLAFSLRGDGRENFLLRQIGVQFSIGYGITGGGFLLDRVAPYKEDVHESQHTLDLLSFAGLRVNSLTPKIYFSEQEEKDFDRKLRDLRIEPKGWIGIQADAGTEAKEWPLDHLNRLISMLESDHNNLQVVFIGSNQGRGQWLEKRLAENPSAGRRSLVGKTGLRELFYLIRSLKCFIGADSGPTHVAAAMGIPTLFLASGTNNFELWGPQSESAYFLRHSVPCSPCHLVQCNVNGHPCMTGIAPEKVLEWLEERRFA